ncbi:MAG: MFS transporter [Campylobacterales bacterium]|nr:MFS transporter [Campylobacterales bacterium]
MKNIVFSLSFIVALRFFGLFLVMPLLSVYAASKSGTNSFLIGLVVGGYALSQLLFQLPFGILSDKMSRKTLTLVGLLIFAVGSVVSAMSSDIYMLLVGRFLQGAGAISSVVTAMIADFTSEEKRSKAMATMGGSIAMSFAAAILVGPYVGGHYGVDMLFWITAALAIAAFLYLLFFIPDSPRIHHAYDGEPPRFVELLTDSNLVKMYVNMFFHGFLLTIAFMIIPLELTTKFGWAKNELWQVYIPALFFGFVFMTIAAIAGEKYNKIRQIFVSSIFINAVAFFLFGMATSSSVFVVASVLFFIGFNMLEPLLQSTVSKYAKASQRGAALGVFTTSQYLGVFLGGAIGGAVLHYMDLKSLSLLLTFVSFLWLIYMLKMQNPIKASFLYLDISMLDENMIVGLKEVKGIVDTYINKTENVLVIKYEKETVEEEYLKGFLRYVDKSEEEG